MVNILPTTSKNLDLQMMLLCLNKDEEDPLSEDSDKDSNVAKLNDYLGYSGNYDLENDVDDDYNYEDDEDQG